MSVLEVTLWAGGYLGFGMVIQFVCVLLGFREEPDNPPLEIIPLLWPLAVVILVICGGYWLFHAPVVLGEKTREWWKYRPRKTKAVGTPDGRLSIPDHEGGEVSIHGAQ